MQYFSLLTVVSLISNISQLEWPQILVPTSVYIKFVNVERTSLSLIVFRFRKSTLGGDGDLRTCLWALRRISYTWISAGWYLRRSVTPSSTFFISFLKQSGSFYQFYSFNFKINMILFVCIHGLITTVLIARDGY